ncbi:hypothetical protein BBD42_03065 [Paenibacillus sp. BIHB 4019]|uniref:Uncharacterized protein n=1 Tax=Paenibacillus sp. BIHB 4019 TaxID=1870819 RepID=A0A1B2DCV7_9BACL|nr:hypothetical protein BBD42_03065 [Paenibacillus sp. BIHB 4019]
MRSEQEMMKMLIDFDVSYFVTDMELFPPELGNWFSDLIIFEDVVQNEVLPTDRQYWTKPPTAKEFDDCCNEFWMVSTYYDTAITTYTERIYKKEGLL